MKLLKTYYPYPKFPAISISGTKCVLKCRHCAGYYLKNMIPANNPEKLVKICKVLAANDANGVLISGGYDKKGRLLNLGKMISAMKKIKKETGLMINIHSGFVETNLLENLADCVDVASVDIAGDKTIKNIFRLQKTSQDYFDNIKKIKNHGIEVVPHICVGFGEELHCLELLKEVKPEIIVFIGFRQTEGTELENFAEPKPEDWKNVITHAKKLFPETELALGCMRSRKNRVEVELEVLKAGIDRIVIPAKKTLAFAKINNYEIKRYETCCAVP